MEKISKYACVFVSGKDKQVEREREGQTDLIQCYKQRKAESRRVICFVNYLLGKRKDLKERSIATLSCQSTMRFLIP